MDTLVRQDKEAKGGFSSASEKRNARALKQLGFQTRMEMLDVDGETEAVGFVWGPSKEDAPKQRWRYMNHIRDQFPIPGSFIWIDANGEVDFDESKDRVRSIESSVPVLNFDVPGVYSLAGTTDVLLVPAEQEECPLDNIELLVELKKQATKRDKEQTIVELFAHGMQSADKRVFALLTDLREYFRFFWFERDGAFKFVKFSQVLKSPTAALRIITGALQGGADDLLGKRCPRPFDRRLSAIAEALGDYESYDGKGPGGGFSDKRPDGGGGGGDGGPAPKDESNGTSKKTGASNNSQQGPGARFALAESWLPGANLLLLMDGSDPRSDLEVAREHALTFVVPHMPGLAAKPISDDGGSGSSNQDDDDGKRSRPPISSSNPLSAARVQKQSFVSSASGTQKGGSGDTLKRARTFGTRLDNKALLALGSDPQLVMTRWLQRATIKTPMPRV
jgi:hypothetical protein